MLALVVAIVCMGATWLGWFIRDWIVCGQDPRTFDWRATGV